MSVKKIEMNDFDTVILEKATVSLRIKQLEEAIAEASELLERLKEREQSENNLQDCQ